MAKKTNATGKGRRIRLIQSDDAKPAMQLGPGRRFEVTTVTVVSPTEAKPQALAARLCGGSGTCLALIDLGPSE